MWWINKKLKFNWNSMKFVLSPILRLLVWHMSQLVWIPGRFVRGLFSSDFKAMTWGKVTLPRDILLVALFPGSSVILYPTLSPQDCVYVECSKERKLVGKSEDFGFIPRVTLYFMIIFLLFHRKQKLEVRHLPQKHIVRGSFWAGVPGGSQGPGIKFQRS